MTRGSRLVFWSAALMLSWFQSAPVLAQTKITIGVAAMSPRTRVRRDVEPGEVLVTSTVKQLVGGSEIDFTSRGAHTLKGVADQWELFAVVS